VIVTVWVIKTVFLAIQAETIYVYQGVNLVRRTLFYYSNRGREGFLFARNTIPTNGERIGINSRNFRPSGEDFSTLLSDGVLDKTLPLVVEGNCQNWKRWLCGMPSFTLNSISKRQLFIQLLCCKYFPLFLPVSWDSRDLNYGFFRQSFWY